MVTLTTDDSRRHELNRSAKSVLGLMETVLRDNGLLSTEFTRFEVGIFLLSYAMAEEARKMMGIEYIPDTIAAVIMETAEDCADAMDDVLEMSENFKKGVSDED